MGACRGKIRMKIYDQISSAHVCNCTANYNDKPNKELYYAEMSRVNLNVV